MTRARHGHVNDLGHITDVLASFIDKRDENLYISIQGVDNKLNEKIVMYLIFNISV